MQRGKDFAEKGNLCSPFRSCKMGVRVLRSGTRVPKGGFAAAKHPSKWGHNCEIRVTVLQNGTRVPKSGFVPVKHPSKWRLGCEMEDFKAWRFRNHFAAAKWMYRAAKWHSCAKGSLRSCENFRKGR